MENDKILLAHGGGGRLSYELISNLFLPAFKNPILEALDDSASLAVDKQRLAFSTDSYTVKPLFFPGGDIGRLAVYGTVNDLAMVGALPLYISISLVIEEGLALSVLKKIIDSIKEAANKTKIKIVTGDTKVVEKGGIDKLFINTTGIGSIPEGVSISGKNGKVGDMILLSGTVGDHGIAVLSQREGFNFQGEIKTDCQPLNNLVKDMLKASKGIHVLRDPTRGGLATALNEIALSSDVEMIIDEEKIPIKEEVKGACEMLGLDPLSVANEGKLIALVEEEASEKVLEAMKGNPLAQDATIIGKVEKGGVSRVILKTLIGGKRILDLPSGELLPRIC